MAIIRLIPFKVKLRAPDPEKYDFGRDEMTETVIWIQKRREGASRYYRLQADSNFYDRPEGWTCVGAEYLEGMVLLLIKEGEILQKASRELCEVV